MTGLTLFPKLTDARGSDNKFCAVHSMPLVKTQNTIKYVFTVKWNSSLSSTFMGKYPFRFMFSGGERMLNTVNME